ncbi:hypothetical protein B0H17DRAFT_1060194 [Mycena rosella]|uniref:Uncharacterized protein n=1 Tax=Mycena rosella TaxID=1033263 RepID=A0AAD7DKM2_MYCRO|nr:hypothetical protein B0H17DRAFT_1060194 [Mycena rosella]
MPPKHSLCAKSPKILVSPARSVLGKVDLNRSPQNRKNTNGTGPLPIRPNKVRFGGAVPCILCSLPASQPTTTKNPTDGSSATPAEGRRTSKPPSTDISARASDATFSTDRALASLQRILDNFSSGSIGSLLGTTELPPRLCVRPPTACSVTTKTSTPTRRARHLTVIPSPAKKAVELGSSPGRYRHTSDLGATKGWR